jgi:LysR family carnitine catabolism transcriptional activator
LLKFPFITLQRPSTVRRLLERTLEETGIGVHVAMECHQLATVGNLVARGLGVSAVPALSRVQMTKLGARCLTLSSPLVERSVGLIRRRDTELSTAARVLFEMAMEVKPENT